MAILAVMDYRGYFYFSYRLLNEGANGESCNWMFVRVSVCMCVYTERVTICAFSGSICCEVYSNPNLVL